MTTHTCRWYLEAAGRPGEPLQAAVQATADILARRWPAVLRVACALADRGELRQAEIEELVAADPYRADGRAAYAAWRATWPAAGPARSGL